MDAARPWSRSDPAWPVEDAVVAWETGFFDAGYDVVDRPDGERAEYYWIEPADAVIIVAIDGADLLTVEQYRPRYRMTTLELPAGGVDAAESPREAAKRELREETGYRATHLVHLESYVPSGWARYLRHVFVADGLEAGDPDREDGEFLESGTIAAETAIETVRATDGPTIGGALTPLLLARADGYL